MVLFCWIIVTYLVLTTITADGRLFSYGEKIGLFGRGSKSAAAFDRLSPLPDLRRKTTEPPVTSKPNARTKSAAETAASLDGTDKSYVSYLPEDGAADDFVNTFRGHHVVPHADLPSSIKNLVSSVKGFALFGQGKAKKAHALEQTQDHENTNIYHPLLQKGFEHFRTLTEVLGRFIDQKKGHIVLGGKVAAGLWIGVLLARRAYNWYSGLAEYALVLDPRDHLYASQGAVLHPVALHLLASLNHTAAAELKYDALYEKVVLALERPCTPQSMSIYAVQAGRATAVLLSEIDNRIRVFRRRVARYSSSGASSSECSDPLIKGAVRGGAGSAKHITTKTSIVDAAGSARAAEQEGHILLALQRSLTLLQARQSDASLRLTRLQVLQAANTIEDLLLQRKKSGGKLSVRPSVGKNSDSRVGPVGNSGGGGGTIKSKVRVPEGERAVVLERMLKGYYAIAGQIQHHLDALREVEAALLCSLESSVDGKDSSADSARTTAGTTSTHTKCWAALEAWVSDASTVSSQALSAVSSGDTSVFVWDGSTGAAIRSEDSYGVGSSLNKGVDGSVGSSAYTVDPCDYSDASANISQLSEVADSVAAMESVVLTDLSSDGGGNSTTPDEPPLLLTYNSTASDPTPLYVNTTSTTNANTTFTNTTTSPKRAHYTLPPHTLRYLRHTAATLHTTFALHRAQWRASGVILTQLQRTGGGFSDQLFSRGLMKKSHRGALGLIRANVVLKLLFWGGVAAGGLGLTKKSSNLSFRTVNAEAVARHVNSFVERRVLRPLTNILNDVVLNKRTSITDHAALKDAKRSLTVMLYDFLTQHVKKLSEGERRRVSQAMDMRPVSEEYEQELRRPMQSLVSGKIARLVLIQLQFVKKELLVAMQAIDDLFNANQVNLQLLAITPAVLSIIALNIVYKTLLGVVRATSQGRKVESSVVIYGELREGIRQLERVLLMSEANGGGFNGAHGSGWDSANTICDGGTATATATTHTTHTDTNDWSTEELGRALSMLHRLQNTLVHNTNVFDRRVLAQVQEDLRDLTLPSITITRRMAIVHRLYRVLPSMQSSRNIWNSALLQ